MVNGTVNSVDPRYLPAAQAFSACTICDSEYPAGTETCPKCASPLSTVRRCPDCQRILSARHETCIYCAFSLLAKYAQSKEPEVLVPIPRSRRTKPNHAKGVIIAFSVFLVIVLIGVTSLLRTKNPAGAEIKATSFAIHNAQLHLEPSDTSGVARTVENGGILRFSRIVRDNTGKPWFIVPENGRDFAISVNDVAPPKASEAEDGARMLQAWLLSFDRADLAPDAVQAVNYYCSEFQTSSHCEELRWVAAERLRYIAQHSAKRNEILAQTRELYKALANQNGRHAAEARKALDEIPEAQIIPRQSDRPAPEAPKAPKVSKPEFRQYALVDAAEVQLRIPDLSKLTPGASIQTPIAKEIRVNGQLVVPSNATCILEVLNGSSPKDGILARLTAIEFANRKYPVATEPKRLDKPGSIVVFRLDSSLLIGH